MGKKGKSKYAGKFLPGHKFGHWTVVDGTITGSPAQIKVKCTCDCERLTDVYTLVKGKSTSCGCIVRTGEDAPNWKGVNGLSRTTIARNTQYMTSHGNGAISISPIDMANVYASQSGVCAITGQTLTTSTARLERVDANQPYNASNVVWVHNSISPVAATYGVQGAITIANSVVSNTSQPNNIFEKLGFKPTKP